MGASVPGAWQRWESGITISASKIPTGEQDIQRFDVSFAAGVITQIQRIGNINVWEAPAVVAGRSSLNVASLPLRDHNSSNASAVRRAAPLSDVIISLSPRSGRI